MRTIAEEERVVRQPLRDRVVGEEIAKLVAESRGIERTRAVVEGDLAGNPSFQLGRERSR
jgi:hypothetical protein